MQAVTITQITAIELETLIENSIKKVLNNQQAEQPTETDRWFDLNELCQYHEVLLQFVIIFLRQVRKK